MTASPTLASDKSPAVRSVRDVVRDIGTSPRENLLIAIGYQL